MYALYLLFYNETDANIASVRQAAEACGPIGQKLLQYLVMNDGFLSSSAKKRLSYIFEDCITDEWADTQKIYLEDYGRAIEDDFKITEVDKIPIGSGTIGQVYKLYNRTIDGYIALKVRHLNVEAEAAAFIKTVNRVIRVINAVSDAVPFTIMICECLNNINIQLDYALEAANTETLRYHFRNDHHIVIPHVYYNSMRTIAMSFHEGVPYTDIDDNSHKMLKSKISHDMFLFNMASLLIYDFLHCDLHYGNWKVQIGEDEEYKLVIYDCGIIGSTHNDQINKKICMACMDGDYNKIYAIMVPDSDSQPNGPAMRKYTEVLMDTYYMNRSDKFSDFLKQLFVYKIKINTMYLRCIQGLLTCLSMLVVSSEKLTKALGKDGSRLEIFVSYYSGVLEKINKYPALLKYLNAWMESDPNIEIVFYDWLDDLFGHRDKEVFIDAILHRLLTT